MRTIANLLKAAEAVKIPFQVELSFFDTTQAYTDLQRGQLKEGIRSDGEHIFNIKTGSDEYSPAYAKKKGRSKPIDLKDTGDFYHGIFADVREKEIVVDSADWKSGMLIERYGEEIFTLEDERKLQYAKIAQSKLIENIENELNLK